MSTVKANCELLTPDGWQIETGEHIIGHGGCGARVELQQIASTTNCYVNPTLYAADFGLVVGGQHGKFSRFIELVTQHLKTVKERVRHVSQTGWYTSRDGKEYFVLPNQVYGALDGEGIICRPKGGRAGDYGANGTLEGWQDGIARLAVGNSRLVLAISAGFAGPLLKPMGVEGGGLNCRGSSSIGKTTALRAAASVLGGPNYLKSCRTTDNALEGTAAAHNDALLLMDELAQIDAKAAAQIAYMLSNGDGKGRMNPDGTMKEANKWRVLFILSAEITLADKIEEGGGKAKAGQAARVIDIPADAGCGYGIFEKLHEFKSGAQLSDAIRDCSARHYGTAVHEYLTRLIVDVDAARQKVRAHMDAFKASVCPGSADGQVTRVCERFALIAAAGELATEWGVTGWPDGEAVRAAEKCFKAWLDQRGSSGPQEIVNALSRLRLVIEQHGASRFQVWGKSANLSGGHVINQLGYVKPDENKYYFSTEAFKTEVCKGIDPKVMCKAPREVGALDSDGFRNQKQLRVPHAERRFLYVINSDRLFSPDDDEAPF